MPAKKRKQKMIRIALSGDRGRMGRSLKKIIKRSPILKVTAQANRTLSPKSWRAEDIDAVIDFSLPDLFSKSLNWALKNKKAFVSGTTGLNSYHKKALKKAAQKIPIFYEENMSGGIFLLSHWLKDLFNKELSITIEDIHHKNKKDKPSGTALKLKNSLPSFLKSQAQIKSFRKGRHFGTHRLLIKSSEEILILEHQALNRDLFSKGALQALLFILKKKKGYYRADDLYGQKKALSSSLIFPKKYK